MEQVREVEHKFRVHGLYRIPDLTHVEGVERVADGGTAELAATYYDTNDLRLVREGITLRRRAGGADEGWHLKLPTSRSGVRDEVRLPLEDATDRPPSELTQIVAVVTRNKPIYPVASLRTTRHSHQLYDGNDQHVAELADDHVAVLSAEGQTTTRFRELELELTAESNIVLGVSNALAAEGASEGEFVAKAARALGPAAVAAPEIPPPPPDIAPTDTAETCIAAYLATHVRRLRRHDIGFRTDPARPGDHVHQMRVAARRLRSGLRVFSQLLDDEWAGKLAAELRWFARGLTELRETEVLLPRLAEDAKQLPASTTDSVQAVIHEQLGNALAQARDDAVRLMTDNRYFALHDRLVEAVHTPLVTEAAMLSAGDLFPALADEAWKRLEHSAKQLTPDAPNKRWHAVRLAAKRARYAGEAVAPALGAPAATYVKQIKRLTTILGEHQDAAQAADRVTELAAAPEVRDDPDVVSGLGVVAAWERDRVLQQREHFRSAWRETGDAGRLLRVT